MRSWLGALRIVPPLLLALLAMPASAAALEIPPGGVTLEVVNAAGEPDYRAGAHPDRLITGFKLSGGEEPAEDMKSVVINLPPGLSGDPNAVPPCPRVALTTVPLEDRCPPESQVGVMIAGGGEPRPLYSVEPAPNELALFAAIPLFAMRFVGSLRPADQGLSFQLQDLLQGLNLSKEGRAEIWGVPADHQQGTSIPRKALLTTPTRCDAGPLWTTVDVRTWQQPELPVAGRGDTGHPLVGCDGLPFDPGLGFSLANAVADAPTGAQIELTVPQSDDPGGRASSQMKGMSVVLPEGMTISPAGAEGLSACADAQFGPNSSAAPTCPPSSRIGTVELTAPQFEKPLTGAIYLGEEHPGDRFRMLMVAHGRGVETKLAGSLRPDPRTGQLTATMDDLPQTSFARMSLRFDGGSGALLATPLACGAAATAATFVPYSGTAPVSRGGSVAIATSAGGNCQGAAPFAPTFTASGSSARAGGTTSFLASVQRRDGEQLPNRLTVLMPPGMNAALGSLEPCSPAAAGSGACPSGSRIGSVLAELGPGTDPVRLQGTVYLTGPYRGAPFGAALVFPARIGPFDLDTLVVRGALRIDPLSGQVSIETDPLPRTVGGIAIRFRTIHLEIDRPDFLRNPTSCAPESAAATVTSLAGTSSSSTSPFRAEGCVALPFRPVFSMALTAPAQLRTKRGHPGLRISARIPSGGANLRRADIELPSLLRLDSSGLRQICPRGAATAGRCPRGSRVGTAQGRTPLLDGTLRGPLYVVQPRGDGAPDLWASLEDAGVRVELKTETSEKDGHLETSLRDLPDFPLDDFAMTFASGKRGVLALRHGVCAGGRARPITPLRLEGQNGAIRRERVRVAVPVRCGDG